MGLLSNLLRFRGARGADSPVRVRVAKQPECDAAMRMVLGAEAGLADAEMAREFIRFGETRGVDFSLLHIAERGGKIVAAMLPIASPGKTVLLLAPPGGLLKGNEDAAREVVRAILEECARRQIILAQALIDPADGAMDDILRGAGFGRMAELYYLQGQPPPGVTMPQLPQELRWVGYSEGSHGLFARAIVATYENSLDCPALNGRRDVDDILAGHKATGVFDPSMWMVLAKGEHPLGLLLLSPSLRNDAMELVYLGLVSEARGLGLAELMMQQAQAMVVDAKHERLCLAVDSANVPALKLYYRHGMARVASKVAMLKDLRN